MAASRADEIDVPVHVVVAEENHLVPPGPTQRVIDRLPDPRVHRVPSGHFEVHFDSWFEPVLQAQAPFLTDCRTLIPGHPEIPLPGLGAIRISSAARQGRIRLSWRHARTDTPQVRFNKRPPNVNL